MNITTRTIIQPEIFIPKEKYTLIEVLLERGRFFDILWYRWPRDGWFFWVNDYEPVIIIYRRDGTLCYLVTRRHWSYQTYSEEEDLVLPPQVLFDGIQHPPIAKTNETNEFEEKKADLLPQQYNLRNIKPEDIPMMYRIGQGHPSAFGRIVRDPAVYAKEIYEDFCR